MESTIPMCYLSLQIKFIFKSSITNRHILEREIDEKDRQKFSFYYLFSLFWQGAGGGGGVRIGCIRLYYHTNYNVYK